MNNIVSASSYVVTFVLCMHYRFQYTQKYACTLDTKLTLNGNRNSEQLLLLVCSVQISLCANVLPFWFQHHCLNCCHGLYSCILEYLFTVL